MTTGAIVCRDLDFLVGRKTLDEQEKPEVAMTRSFSLAIRSCTLLLLLGSSLLPADLGPAVSPAVPAQAETASWPMAAANPQRTSWSPEEVRGQLAVEWFRPIEPFVSHKTQVIAAEDKLFVSTARGLYAFQAATGAHLWTYGTEMPLGHSPTYANGILYVGGYDRRIHAVNASDGKLKSGWTFVGAGAGFETNPLVINSRVYAGNRDGYFYCLDANNGSLLWKWRDETDEYPDAPIRYSAAYKNGIFYFGSDNSHAYAIRDNGASAALVWKSEKLPGVGFSTYWPVVYTDKSSGKDYVLFSGTKKEVGWVWFGDSYFDENYDIFAGIPTGGLIGATGSAAGDWVSGTRTIDATKIQQYLNQNPHKRHLFVLDAASGTEYPVFAPVTWVSATHGGSKVPPVIGKDGVIYTFIGYKNGDPGLTPNAGASGGISGWKFGTQYVSQIYDYIRGYADEAVTFTSGGNVIYWTEGFNMGYGAFEVNKPYGANAIWEYSPCGGLWGCLGIPGYDEMYQSCGLYGSCNGIYGGGTNGLFPYKGRVYMLERNALIAFSSTGGARKLATVGTGTQTPPQSSALPASYLTQRLEAEITKMIAAGHLRPGFHDSGLWGQAANGAYSPFVEGDHLAEYFHNPGDTVTTLLGALPYLPPSLQAQVKTYVKNNYGPGSTYDFTQIAHIGWKEGAQREIFTDTPERAALISRPNDDPNKVIATVPRTYSQIAGEVQFWKFPQMSFYAAWKYAEVFPAEALAVFNALKGKLEPTSSNPKVPTDAEFIKFPYLLNAYIAGYRGYLELERLAGLTSAITQSSKWNEYTRLVNLRVNNFSKDAGTDDSFAYMKTMNVARNFMFLVPELADELRTGASAKVQDALTEYGDIEPYWFVSKFDETYGEGVYQPLYDFNALFLANAYILQEPYSELVKHLDVPAFYRGDLFYIQNLVAALQAASVGPSPTFADVPFNHLYHDEIEALYQAGYTAGCNTNPLRYCPEQTMNRGESAVFVERGIHSATYDPSAPASQVFADLPLDSWAAKWVNGLWQDQYTAGCGTNPLVYCPWQGHTRAEGCVFYLRMLNGASYEPPQPTQQTFADVPLDVWYAKWVQAAYVAGLIPACQTSPALRICPNDPLTRAMAAYMMVQAKGLGLP